jgi:Uma2 family endonuclease
MPSHMKYIPLKTYLTTSYEPGVDYVDGELEDRYVGEYDHNMIQQEVLVWFREHRKEWGIRVVQEQRTRVANTKVRLPDVSVFSRSTPVEQVFTRPQLISIEILSPEDLHSRIQKKIDDYISFGVKNIWVIDSETRAGWDCSDGDWKRSEHFTAKDSSMYLSLRELFARMDVDNAE